MAYTLILLIIIKRIRTATQIGQILKAVAHAETKERCWVVACLLRIFPYRIQDHFTGIEPFIHNVKKCLTLRSYGSIFLVEVYS